jgi:hypothetical protein
MGSAVWVRRVRKCLSTLNKAVLTKVVVLVAAPPGLVVRILVEPPAEETVPRLLD